MEPKRSGIEEQIEAQKMRRPDGEAPETEAASLEEMAAGIAKLEAAGALPEGFDLESAGRDEAFIELLAQFPAEAAVRIYTAEKRAEQAESGAKQRMNELLAHRNALPRSTRPGISASPKPDFDGMSSEAFRAYEQQLKRAASRGVRVPL